jgi:hypothetical protein
MKDFDLRCARFEHGLRSGPGSRRSDNDLDKQVRNYRKGSAPIAAADGRVRDILNEEGVSVIQYVIYLNFGRRMARLSRMYTDKTLRFEAMLAVAQWQYQGSSRDILTTICRQVFDLDLDAETQDGSNG